MKHLPEDLRAEALLAYLPEGCCKVSVQGPHQRNAHKDIAGLETLPEHDDVLMLQLGRNSLYTALPEVLFHQVDRFSNLPEQEKKERFREEYEEQEQEKSEARHFFSPIDLMLIQLKTDVYKKIADLSVYNTVLERMLSDQLTDCQRKNRFIKELIHFLPYSRHIRGNKTLLTLMLRKVLTDDEITFRPKEVTRDYSDEEPRYGEQLGASLDYLYAGAAYTENVICYALHYWPTEACDEHFLELVDDVETMRAFVQSYFLGLEEEICIDISYKDDTLRLSDDIHYHYLGYNTNL